MMFISPETWLPERPIMPAGLLAIMLGSSVEAAAPAKAFPSAEAAARRYCVSAWLALRRSAGANRAVCIMAAIPQCGSRGRRCHAVVVARYLRFAAGRHV